MTRATNAYEQVYAIVARIPRGRVATYGQIAEMTGRLSPRFVGWALNALRTNPRKVPWHRVVNARGQLSTAQLDAASAHLQQTLLEAEGVVFLEEAALDLERYRWKPGARK